MRKIAWMVAMGLALGTFVATADPVGPGYGRGYTGCAAAATDTSPEVACPMARYDEAGHGCPVFDQGCGYGPGAGRGYGRGAGPGYGPGYGRGYGMGPGAGRGPGAGFGPGGGVGAGLLTPQELRDFRIAMHSAATVEECRTAVAKHRELVTQRAKEKGVSAPLGPRDAMCERMQAHGMFG